MINEHARRFSERIEEGVDRDADEPIEVSSMFSKTALDIVGHACLGVDLSELSAGSSSSSTFYHCYEQLLNLPPVGQLVFALNTLVPVRSWLPVKENRDFVHAMAEVRRLLMEQLREKKTEILGEGGIIKKDFLEQADADMLTYMVMEMGKQENLWTDDDILGHLLTIMSGGHETTAGALTWALLACCQYPEMQKRLRDEIKTHIPHDRSPNHVELEKLKYMSHFIKEVLRCYSPIVWIPRAPRAPLTLPSVPDIVIPAGTTILISPTALHYNPTLWGPDADTFNPERHEPNHPSAKLYPESSDPHAFATFSNGPRICIGKAFAMQEMKSVFTEILRHWELRRGWGRDGEKLSAEEEFDHDEKLEDGERAGDCENRQEKLLADVKVQNFITLKPRSGLWVKFRRIDG